jgi:hypothetical protein
VSVSLLSPLDRVSLAPERLRLVRLNPRKGIYMWDHHSPRRAIRLETSSGDRA